MILVVLDPEELQEALELAQQRNAKPAHTNKKFDAEHGDEEIHYMSALAEVAWSKQTGWPVDTSVQYGDGGVDFRNNGRTYQIKARDVARYSAPDLLCRKKYVKADRFILAEVNLQEPDLIRFVGWCTKDELLLEIKDIRGKGERYIRWRHDLREIPRELI